MSILALSLPCHVVVDFACETFLVIETHSVIATHDGNLLFRDNDLRVLPSASVHVKTLAADCALALSVFGVRTIGDVAQCRRVMCHSTDPFSIPRTLQDWLACKAETLSMRQLTPTH